MAKEAAPVLSTLAGLHRIRVVNEKGETLGHVFDMRTRYDPDEPGQGALVTDLIFGTRGFLRTIGLHGARGKSIPWQKVLAVHEDRIVVRR